MIWLAAMDTLTIAVICTLAVACGLCWHAAIMKDGSDR